MSRQMTSGEVAFHVMAFWFVCLIGLVILPAAVLVKCSRWSATVLIDAWEEFVR